MGNPLTHLPPVQIPPTNVAAHQPISSSVVLTKPVCDNVVVNHPPMVPSSAAAPLNNSMQIQSANVSLSSAAGHADVKVEEDTKSPIASLQGQQQQLPTTPTTVLAKKPGLGKENYTPPNRRDPTFWCDLCQAVVTIAKVHHFASTHFQERLRKILPVNPPFHCPLCRHEGKHFFNLSTHFLKQHNVMESWTRKALEQLEDEAIAKAQEREAKGLALDGSEDHKKSKHYISSGEEMDTSVSLIKLGTNKLFCVIKLSVQVK